MWTAAYVHLEFLWARLDNVFISDDDTKSMAGVRHC